MERDKKTSEQKKMKLRLEKVEKNKSLAVNFCKDA